MKKIFLLLAFFAMAKNITAQNPYMVKDILPAKFASSDPTNFLNINGTLYFSAVNNATIGNGRELWKSDGTEIGTMLVKDINPGTPNSTPNNLTNLNGVLYFTATDGINGEELWKSDGTAAGTVMVKDINAGANNSNPRDLVNINGIIYFAAGDEINGEELWKTDGTTIGTVLVKDIFTGVGISYPHHLFNFNGVLYFNARDNTNGYELWKSDGSSIGTVRVEDINLGAEDSNPKNFTTYNGNLYFNADNGTNGVELWRTDGTSNGTILVRDINTGSTGSSPNSSDPKNLIVFNNLLFFVANKLDIGYELWKTDGTTIGTTLFKDISPGLFPDLAHFLVFNGSLYFTADDGINGQELWKSDGSTIGTVLFKDINSGLFSSNPDNLTAVNGVLYFTANNAINGVELWKSDGTAVGTTLVKDINATSYQNADPASLTNVNGVLYFTANNTLNGYEFWKSDGTMNGTNMVKDIGIAAISSSLGWDSFNLNGIIYFAASDGLTGLELWKSDGTIAGTVMVKDINIGYLSSGPDNFRNVNGVLFFTANDGIHGRELWKSDGTSNGTVMVKDLTFGIGNTDFRDYEAVNGMLFFTVNNRSNINTSLYKTDGTIAGTVLVKNFSGGIWAGSNGYRYFLNLNGILYFSANDGGLGIELWKSDGTAAGTVLVKDIYPGSANSYPNNLTVFNGNLYFFTQTVNSNSNNELWTSNGTANGTYMIGNNFSLADNLTNIDNTSLYFSAYQSAFGTELWRSSGLSTSGASMVKDIYPGPASSFPKYFAELNGKIHFSATNVFGTDLWKSDGSSTGTNTVRTIILSAPDIKPTYITNVNGTLYFGGGEYENELWKSDGTNTGTVLAKDIFPGFNASLVRHSSAPNNLKDATNGSTHKLFFNATNDLPNLYAGRELWALGNCGTTNITADTTTVSFNEEKQITPATLTCNCDILNNLISSVNATGASPITGNINSKVWVEQTQPSTFVKRHYEINPSNNAATATGRVTLYFAQTEFDDYNMVNTIKLPINSTDAAGISNIRIEKRSGTSTDGVGLPFSYSGSVITINPNTTGIVVWNINRWEISFDVNGFGGFFVKTTAAITPVTYTFNGNGSWSNSSNWLGGIIPPAILTSPNEILIDPIAGGECVLKLSTAQTIATGAKIIVAAAKKFRVEGNLMIHQ